MAILKGHIGFYRTIFKIPGFLKEPFLTFGYQDIIGNNFPEDFRFKDVNALLRARGVKDITTLDLFDERADWRFDMNAPLPREYHEKYQTVMDIGSLEHLFDSAQCLENCMRMVKPGGFYFLETPVNGCLYHGFHTFNPDMLIQAFQLNGFSIEYLGYISFFGVPLKGPEQAQNALIVIVGKKTAPMGDFRVPQQGGWKEINQKMGAPATAKFDIGGWPRLEYWISELCPPALLTLLKKIRHKISSFHGH